MRYTIVLLAALFGLATAKEKVVPAEGLTFSSGQLVYFEKGPRGPRKNYRAQLARQYFGGGARCHKWNRFCR